MYPRLSQWRRFSKLVELHIEIYTQQQYGNPEGDEQIESFTIDQIKSQLARYVNRMDKGARGPAEELRDMFKIAHYAQFAYDKLSDRREVSSAEEGAAKADDH